MKIQVDCEYSGRSRDAFAARDRRNRRAAIKAALTVGLALAAVPAIAAVLIAAFDTMP